MGSALKIIQTTPFQGGISAEPSGSGYLLIHSIIHAPILYTAGRSLSFNEAGGTVVVKNHLKRQTVWKDGT